MPVARIITTSPAETEELRRQLTAAGYSVKFAAPNEEFSDADIVVAAANVHVDYALQYASEVAAEADADVIVAPGVVAGSAEQWEKALSPAAQVPQVVEPAPAHKSETPADALFGTTLEIEDAQPDSGAGIRETLGDYGARIGGFWEQLKQRRELAGERKRLEREQRAVEREEQRRVLHQKRIEAEARMAAERERLRAQRRAEEQRLRREQEEMRRAIEQERTRVADEQKRLALEEVLSRAAECQRVAMQQERARAAERERLVPAPVSPPPIVAPSPVVRPTIAAPVRRAPIPRRLAARRPAGRDRRLQRAAFIASVAALLVMLGFAAALNIHPSSPMPHSMVQNPVQEKSPFGAASITPATTTPGPAAKPAVKPVAHPAPPAEAARPATQPAKPSPGRTRRAQRDNYVAEDEVIVHHYGQTATQQTAAQPKHPPSTQTRAGIPKYTDQ